METRASQKQYGTRTVNRFDTPIPNWRRRRGDAIKDHDLAYAFYVLLDDAALEEVFEDFAIPVD